MTVASPKTYHSYITPSEKIDTNVLAEQKESHQAM